MSGLFGAGGTISQTEERLANIQIQTSSYGGCLAIVYGTNRSSGNLVDYDDFTAIAHTTKQEAGKGGGGTTMESTTYTYTAMVMLALCEGPDDGATQQITINRVWRDKEVGSMSGYGFTLLNGQRTQTPWSYLVSKHPERAIGYGGTVIVAHAACDLGNSGTLKNHSFEIQGLKVIGNGNPDAHPADVIPDLLTNVYYGAGWPAERIGDINTGPASFRTYCTAMGFFFSPVIGEQKQLAEWVNTLCEATNSDPVWSSNGTRMALKIIPYGDQPVSGNGASYVPNTTPIYDLGPDDFMPEKGQDPVRLERVPHADSFNIYPVQFRNRLLDYNTDVVEDPEPVDVDVYGPRKASVTNLDCITRQAHALTISRIKAQRSIECRNRYRFRLGWRYCLLEPMDLVTLTEPLLGLDRKVVRLREVEETEDGYLEMVAEEWPFGVASATAYTTQNGDGYVPDAHVDPGNASSPVLMQPPLLLTGGVQELWLATSGGPLWGGCEIWVSTDGGSSYARVGSLAQPCRHGTLSDQLPAWSDASIVDDNDVLAVALEQGRQQLASATAQDRDDLKTLLWVGGELLAFADANLTDLGKYDLTSLRRGAYGTPMPQHQVGTTWARLDSAVFRYALPSGRLGQQLYIKLVSFNVYGSGRQDIAMVPAYPFTPTVQALPPVGSVTMTAGETLPEGV